MDWQLILTTFGLIFVAELGDKTQLAVLAQTCKYGHPRAVFLGASLALTATTALGAVGGGIVGRLVSPQVLQVVAAVAFVALGILIAREAARAQAHPEQESNCVTSNGARSNPQWKTFAATFGLLFIAEMGDKTQLAVLSLAGKRGEALPVFAGGALALTAVTALAVIGGQSLSRVIPRRVLLWLSAVAFVAMGVLIGAGVL